MQTSTQYEPKQVLVIEDDAILQSMMVLFLETLQYVVMTASTVADSQALLSQRSFDLVLLDMNLPDGSGLEILAALVDVSAAPLVIVTTADETVTTVIGALRNGAFDYLTKPINIEVMQRTLQRATDHIALDRAAIALSQLQAQNMAMRATAGAAVHYLSQDLTVVLAEAQLLEEIVEDDESREGMQRIVTAVQHAASTLDDLRHAQRFVTKSYAAGHMILDVAAAGTAPDLGWDAGKRFW